MLGRLRGKMSETFVVQYVGFKAKKVVREYSFLVRETAREPREFTFTILNEAFETHRARYQDAPDICSLKLRRELADPLNQPLKSHYRISETELDSYRDSHFPKSTKSLFPRKTSPGF
jgi:hypothetical protein